MQPKLILEIITKHLSFCLSVARHLRNPDIVPTDNNRNHLWRGAEKIKTTAGGQRSEALFRGLQEYIPFNLQ